MPEPGESHARACAIRPRAGRDYVRNAYRVRLRPRYDAAMPQPGPRLSRPLYEGLPWIYAGCGGGALVYSYYSSHRALSLIVGLLGFFGILAGVVVLLRRRGFRALRSQYGNQDSLTDLDEK